MPMDSRILFKAIFDDHEKGLALLCPQNRRRNIAIVRQERCLCSVVTPQCGVRSLWCQPRLRFRCTNESGAQNCCTETAQQKRSARWISPKFCKHSNYPQQSCLIRIDPINRDRSPTPFCCARQRRASNEGEWSRRIRFWNERYARQDIVGIGITNPSQAYSARQFLSLGGQRANNTQTTSQNFSDHVAWAMLTAIILSLFHSGHLRHRRGYRHFGRIGHRH